MKSRKLSCNPNSKSSYSHGGCGCKGASGYENEEVIEEEEVTFSDKK